MPNGMPAPMTRRLLILNGLSIREFVLKSARNVRHDSLQRQPSLTVRGPGRRLDQGAGFAVLLVESTQLLLLSVFEVVLDVVADVPVPVAAIHREVIVRVVHRAGRLKCFGTNFVTTSKPAAVTKFCQIESAQFIS